MKRVGWRGISKGLKEKEFYCSFRGSTCFNLYHNGGHPVRHGILRASDFSGALCFTVSRANSYSNKHGTLMWLIIHVLIIAGLSVRVLLRPRRDPASRIAWILFIMALPYVGAFAYLMLGEVRPEKLAGRPGAPKRLAMAGSERYVQSAAG